MGGWPPPSGRDANPTPGSGGGFRRFGGATPSIVAGRRAKLTAVHGRPRNSRGWTIREHAGFEVRDAGLRSTAGPPHPGRLITQSNGADDIGGNHVSAQDSCRERGRHRRVTKCSPHTPDTRPADRRHRGDLPTGLRAVLPPPSARGPAAGLRRAQHRHLRGHLAAGLGARRHRAGLRALRDPVDHPAAVEHGHPARGRLLLRRPGDGPGQRDGHPRPPARRADQRGAAGRDGRGRQQAAA